MAAVWIFIVYSLFNQEQSYSLPFFRSFMIDFRFVRFSFLLHGPDGFPFRLHHAEQFFFSTTIPRIVFLFDYVVTVIFIARSPCFTTIANIRNPSRFVSFVVALAFFRYKIIFRAKIIYTKEIFRFIFGIRIKYYFLTYVMYVCIQYTWKC